MTDYVHWHSEMERVLMDIENIYKKLKETDLSPMERKHLIGKLDSNNGLWKRQRTIYKSLKNVTLLMGNAQEKREAEKEIQEMKATAKKLKEQLLWVIQNDNSKELLGDKTEDVHVTSKQVADATLKQAKENAEGGKKMVNIASNIMDNGQGIMEELEKNADKLRSINNKVSEIDSQITRATKAVNVLRRRLMTDKLFWVFLFLVVAAIAGILIYVAINPNQNNFAVPKEAVPPSPERVKEDADNGFEDDKAEAKAEETQNNGRRLRFYRNIANRKNINLNNMRNDETSLQFKLLPQ